MIWKTREATVEAIRRPTLFLDRDGVVMVDKDYIRDPRDVELVPGAAGAMAAARAAGFRLVGISNQSGLGRGRFTPGDFEAVMQRLERKLAAAGTSFDGFFYCPHAPSDGCRCRKPATGLIDEASAAFPWIPERSWVIGDKVSDVALGRAVSAGAVLVRTGYGAEQEDAVRRRWRGTPRVRVADDLARAVAAILDEERKDGGA